MDQGLVTLIASAITGATALTGAYFSSIWKSHKDEKHQRKDTLGDALPELITCGETSWKTSHTLLDAYLYEYENRGGVEFANYVKAHDEAEAEAQKVLFKFSLIFPELEKSATILIDRANLLPSWGSSFGDPLDYLSTVKDMYESDESGDSILNAKYWQAFNKAKNDLTKEAKSLWEKL
jgi:hypothetical protein